MSVYDSAAAQYESIRAMIVGGELPPGAVLLETALAKKLGVSRTPVREALARLAQEELINREIRGYVVKTRTPEEIREIYDVRIILESACAAAAAEQA
ncbi:GntR family transcriptional regulator, partial [Streptomyces sp. 2MCAF27]